MPAIPVVGAVVGGLIANRGAKKAASAQVESTREANDNALLMQDRAIAAQKEAEAQARADREPWRALGANKLAELGQRTGAGGDLMRDFGMADFQADPGYQFRMDQGMRGMTNSAAARGGLLSGAALKAASSFNQGMASQEYGNARSRYNEDRDQKYNKLANLAGIGQVAANNNAMGASQMGQNIGRGMMQTGEYIGNNLLGAGNARGSSYLAQGNALGNVVNAGISAWNQYNANKPPTLGESGGVNGGGWF